MDETHSDGAGSPSRGGTTKQRGDHGEAIALRHLLAHGLSLVQRNYRTPGRGAAEIDLVMRDADGTLVFVEVRRRASASHGGAAASVLGIKRHRVVRAARHYLMQLPVWPPCRFDVVAIDGEGAAQRIEWLRGAFDAD